MQIQKEKIEKRILTEARKEFDQKGFLKASMRIIALKSGVSTSNIYNYFDNKDDLFLSIVRPTIKKIENYLDNLESGREHRNPANWSFQSHLLVREALVVFIEDNRQILKLIAFQAHGSSLQDYKEQLIERYTSISLKCMHEAQHLYPGIKTNISLFFAHNIASLWMNIILEILMHNIDRTDMLNFFKELMTFMFYGYEGLTEYDFSKMQPKPLE